MGTPRALSRGVGWGRRHGRRGVGKKGVLGGSERPRLKAWLPLNSGLFGIQVQGQLWGRGKAVGGEVTGIRGGETPPRRPAPGLHPGPGSTEGRAPVPGSGAQRPRASEGESKHKVGAGAGRQGVNPERGYFSSRQLGGGARGGGAGEPACTLVARVAAS